MPPRRRNMPQPKVRLPPPTQADPETLKVADYLRNEKTSGLKTRDAVQYERRVEYFKGSKLIDALLSDKYNKKIKDAPPVKTRADAAKIGQQLLSQHFIHRSQRVVHEHLRRWELELVAGPFEEEGLYTWVYEGSKTRLYLISAAMMAGALGVCMIQIWPLWLKIGVWWCSITFLTTFGVLSAVRLALFCAMWIVGFRGIWLFPNLFDDDKSFAGSFVPIFGRGDPPLIESDSEEEWQFARRKSKKKSGDSKTDDDGKDDAAKGSGNKEGETREAREAREDLSFQFGWTNIVIIFGLGGIACINAGFFDAENVPDFVAKRDDLQYYFKSLAAPEVQQNATEGEEERDPFAAPDDDNGERF